MSENDLVKSQNTAINTSTQAASKSTPVPVIDFDIHPKPGTSAKDISCYEETIAKFIEASLPSSQFETCLEVRGDEARIATATGLMQEEPHIISNVARGPHGVVAFQFREESMSAANQLPAALENGNKIMNVSKSPSIMEQPLRTQKKVLEFIRVTIPEQPQLPVNSSPEIPGPAEPNNSFDIQRQNSPFLQNIGEIEKAA